MASLLAEVSSLSPEYILDVGTILFKYVFITFVLYYAYDFLIAPMDRVRKVTEVGYRHIQGPGRKAVISRLRKNRRMGNCPPAFPNGWFVVAESREVSLRFQGSLKQMFCCLGLRINHVASLQYCHVFLQSYQTSHPVPFMSMIYILLLIEKFSHSLKI